MQSSLNKSRLNSSNNCRNKFHIPKYELKTSLREKNTSLWQWDSLPRNTLKALLLNKINTDG